MIKILKINLLNTLGRLHTIKREIHSSPVGQIYNYSKETYFRGGI